VGILGGWHKVIYQAEMSHLLSGASYFYSFGDLKENVWSPVLNFRMPSSSSKARLVILADQGTIEPLGSAVAQQIGRDCVSNGRPTCDVVHVCGDLAYADKV
jgi:hypothetical protein